MQVAILCGGLGTRLKVLTKHTPKSLVKICGKSFIDYQLEYLKKQGIEEVVLCVGHFGDQIVQHVKNGEAYGLSIGYSWDRNEGTADALRIADGVLNDPFFVMYGDSFVTLDFKDMWEKFHQHDKLAMMAVYQNYNKYDNSNAIVESGLVKKYSKQYRTKNMSWIDAGVSLLRHKALHGNAPDLSINLSILASNREVLAYEVPHRFYEIGTYQGLMDFARSVS